MIYAISHDHPIQGINKKDTIDEVQGLDFSWFLLEAIMGLINRNKEMGGYISIEQMITNQERAEISDGQNLDIKETELNTRQLAIQQWKVRASTIQDINKTKEMEIRDRVVALIKDKVIHLRSDHNNKMLINGKGNPEGMVEADMVIRQLPYSQSEKLHDLSTQWKVDHMADKEGVIQNIKKTEVKSNKDDGAGLIKEAALIKGKIIHLDQHKISVSNKNEVNKSDIMDQLTEKIRLQIKEGKQELVVDLKPDFLGKVRIKLISEGGHIRIQFITENYIAKDTISPHIPLLQQVLRQQGFPIQEIVLFMNWQGYQENRRSSGYEPKRLYSSFKNMISIKPISSKKTNEIENMGYFEYWA